MTNEAGQEFTSENPRWECPHCEHNKNEALKQVAEKVEAALETACFVDADARSLCVYRVMEIFNENTRS